jgi:nitrogen fixation protein NifZ
MDPRRPKFQWGQPVTALCDLRNDGSYPDCAGDEMLAPKGEQGEVVRIGALAEGGAPVYLVAFPGGRVVGCLEEEIGAA